MKTENEIKLGIDEAVKEAGFLRKSTNWYREMNETVLVINLQKSNYGDQYYINLGILVKDLPAYPGSKPQPKANQCHIQMRMRSEEPTEEKHLEQLLNRDDKTISSVDRRLGIKQAVTLIALPFLAQCSTVDGIRNAYGQGKLDHAAVFKTVRDSLLT